MTQLNISNKAIDLTCCKETKKRVTMRFFLWTTLCVLSIYILTAIIMYQYTESTLGKYLHESQLSSNNILLSLSHLNQRINSSLQRIESQQIKWSDDVNIKIEIIQNRITNIDFVATSPNQNEEAAHE